MSVSIGIKVNPLRSIMSLPPFGNPFNSPLTGSPVIEHHSPLRKQKQDQQYPCVPPHPLQTSLLRCGRSFPGLSKADIVTSPLSAIPSQSQDLLFNSSFHSPDCVCVCVSLCARSFYQFTLPLPTSLWLTVTSVWLAVPPKSQIWFLLIFHVSGHILSLRRPFLVPIFERGGRPCCLHYRLLSHHSL